MTFPQSTVMYIMSGVSLHVKDVSAGFMFLIQALLDCQAGDDQLVDACRQTMGRLSCERN